ncbi:MULTISPECIES: TIGR02270 family protein [unclassified Myxococcus]|uniref:TIGR02270 family protein n=1 Tax=unclassified Myxococcus TaxID=2648731 RepID=UPI00157B26BC|nr:MULTISPECIES: TIGR02270 family protein [unclassified Myxococcus]NTX37175.1 TIGR02270 family protein [Myxococcus sp. CA033]NTX52109.1 TIGR02270 family protein [Myxococcus sp. CA039A]
MTLRTDIVFNWNHYEQHLDEASFQWGQWEQSLSAPDEIPAEALASEERLLARVDALVLGGEPVARKLLRPALTTEEPERLSTAVFALLEGGIDWAPEVLLQHLREAPPEALPSIQRALEVLTPGPRTAWLQPLLGASEPRLQALALDVLGFQSTQPQALVEALAISTDPKVAASALRAAVRARRGVDWRGVRQALSSPELEVRDAALLAGLLSGHRETWAVCREQLASRERVPGLPALLLSLGTGPEAAALFAGLLRDSELRADALWALGFNGHVSAAEACLEHLEDEAVGHLAAEAFSAITGLPLEGDFVARPPDSSEDPDEAPAAPERHPLPGAGLPLPNAGAIRAWWEQTRKQFQPTVRYLRGRPWTQTSLLETQWTEPMRRRHAWSLELTLRSQGACQLRTRAFLRQQLTALAALRSTALTLNTRQLAGGVLS